jgi:YggT family protein
VLILVAFITIIRIALDIIFFTVIGSVILSWVSPNNENPALELIDEISNKILNPIKQVIPSMGGLDFSPIFLFILINVILGWLQDIIRLIT